MYRVRTFMYFSSAHNLRNYNGNCENLHGHNWKVEVFLESEKLDEIGMLVDFKILKSELKKILNCLDHKYINEIEYFKTVNPTSENMARYIYKELKKVFGNITSKVVVWESENSAAEYYE